MVDLAAPYRAARPCFLLLPLLLGQCAGGTSSAPPADSEADAATTAGPSPDGPSLTEGNRDTAVPADGKRDGAAAEAGSGLSGPSRCPAGALFCEGFEASALDTAVWTITGEGAVYGPTASGATATLDTTKLARGRSAIHFKITQPTSPSEVRQVFIKSKMTFPMEGKKLFIRFFTYIDAVTPSRWYRTFMAEDTATTAGLLYGQQHLAYGTVLVPQSETMPAPSTYLAYGGIQDNVKESPRKAPLGQWSCWEYEIRGDQAKGEMLLSIDDKPVPGFDVTGPVFKTLTLYFGVLNSHNDTIPKTDGFNIWVDEIAVANQRIGCAN